MLHPLIAKAEGAAHRVPSRRQLFFYRTTVVVPVAFALFASLGYQHTTWELCWRFIQTVWLLLALLVAQAMALRWLYFARGRLALEQARQRHEAAKQALAKSTANQSESRNASERVTQQEESSPPPAPVLNLAAVNAQTRKLLRTCVGVAAVAGSCLIWFDVAPGFGLLDYELWSSSSQVTRTIVGEDGTRTLQTISEIRFVTIASLVLAVLVGVVTFVAAGNVPGLLEVLFLQSLPLDAGARYAVSTLARYATITVGLVFAFHLIGIGWSQVQWLVAALAVGLGFGLQELFANFVSGIILLFERPIRVGDIVTIGDVSGVTTRIQIRAATIRNWDRKEFIVPNKELITGRLLNWTLTDQINRIVITIGVAYGTDTDRARQLLFKILREHPLIMDDPAPSVTFEGFGDSALNFVVRAYLPDFNNRSETIHQLYTTIHREFTAAGIEIAFPQHDLNIRSLPESVTAAASKIADSAAEGIEEQQHA